MSTVVLIACSGGWKFHLPGEALVELLGAEGETLSSKPAREVRSGTQVKYLGRLHKVFAGSKEAR